MPESERLKEIGIRRGRRAILDLSEEFRARRLEVGLSQSEVAASVGISRPSYTRIESGKFEALPVLTAAKVAAALGLELSVRVFPGANPLPGAAHGARLMSVLRCVAAPLTFRTEVPLPQRPDRPFEQRAWDAVVFGLGRRTGFEMEMRVRDAQALERRTNNKRRDDPVDSFVLLLADTRNNRRVLAENHQLFPGMARLTSREVVRILKSGQHPPTAVTFVPAPANR
jgi:transcriptional regulator with XRE-family HTH domain